MTDEPEIQRAVRRRVGIAALRRLRRLVDEEVAKERLAAHWARRLAWGFALLALFVAIGLLALR